MPNTVLLLYLIHLFYRDMVNLHYTQVRLSNLINLPKVMWFKHSMLESELGFTSMKYYHWTYRVAAKFFDLYFHVDPASGLLKRGSGLVWWALSSSTSVSQFWLQGDHFGAGSGAWIQLAELVFFVMLLSPGTPTGHSLQIDLTTAPGMRSRGQLNRSAIYSFSVVKNMCFLSMDFTSPVNKLKHI